MRWSGRPVIVPQELLRGGTRRMIRRIAKTGVAVLERAILICAFAFFGVFRRRRDRHISWVVGTHEIASMIHQIANVIPHSYSVSLGTPRFYQHLHYDKSFPGGDGRGGAVRELFRLATGPLALARLAHRAHGFVYVGPRGFLRFATDERAFEFRFLKRHGLRLALYWCGSDIRSTVLMRELERSTGMPNIFTYVGFIVPARETEDYERSVRTRAMLSDTFADIVFDNPTDHKGYVKRHSEPFFYFMQEDRFAGTEEKFRNLSRIVITHAATSPIIKGTQLVRAAIKKLQVEGYQFDYVEMLTATNDEVLDQLRRTHISLNQFYGFTPAVYGLESLATRCAVLQSADDTVETTLAPGANDAWIVTKHYEVYGNLKKLLDSPQLIEPQATRGQEWARMYGSAEVMGETLRQLLTMVLEGRYDREERAKLPLANAWTPPESPQ
jgi:hypothetical protein